MRFIANGPSIPGELLAARDEGQVIFFCGSGVSRARAGLPDFFGLADAVMHELHPAGDSPARSVLDAARKIGKIPGVGGLVPADRIFSLLEREFTIEEVRGAVARSLRPTTDDLRAHRALLDLSLGTDGAIRLVTTNFDPLFHLAEPTLASHGPPDLPDPSRAGRFSGIVHLHGRVGPDYACPLDDEFVLSTADFGRAYLADGWAARFIRTLIQRYQIVFVGYSADDPPVQYLLEALGGASGVRNRIYAFQEGDRDEARALWAAKGVDAIAYDPVDGHGALWGTLEGWAARARDPDAWRGEVLARAQAGPAGLVSHERGMVAHLASTPIGAKDIARMGSDLSAEWLCVFDPQTRYGRPGREGYRPDSPFFDPFAAWGLDGDPSPRPVAPDDIDNKRERPEGAWSAFDLTRRDRLDLDPGTAPSFRGGSAAQVRPLPARLASIADWLVSVAHEPAALWWASGGAGLHPGIAQRIVHALEKEPERTSPAFRRAWRQLLAQGERGPVDHASMPFYRLADTVQADGWTSALARDRADLWRPRLRVGRALGSPRPPTDPEAGDRVVYFEIGFPGADIGPEVPDEHLDTYERGLTDAADLACRLVEEFGHGYYALGPLRPDAHNDEVAIVERDMTAIMREWTATLDRLAALSPDAVQARLPLWALRREAPFDRILIWAAGSPAVDGDVAAGLLIGLDANAFWAVEHQRDLLHVLADRWGSLPSDGRRMLGERLRAGPDPREGEEDAAHRERAAWRSLDRVSWLSARGCRFDFDVEAEVVRLRVASPRWTPESGREADESQTTRVRSVSTDVDPAALLSLPAEEVIPAATAMTGRMQGFIEAQPFRGLVEGHPEIALAALRATPLADSAWAWRDFLSASGRETDATATVVETGHALLALGPEEMAGLVRPAVRWFEDAYERLRETDAGIVDALWSRLITTMEAHPAEAGSGVVMSTRQEREWTFEAINAPSGRLVDLAVRRSEAAAGERITDLWLRRIEALLALPDDLGRFALTLVAGNLSYLHDREEAWTTANVLAARKRSSDHAIAFWSGVFRSQGLTVALLRELGPELAALPTTRRVGRSWNTSLAAFLLIAWSRADVRAEGAALDDGTLRDGLLAGVEELRVVALHQVQQWLGKSGRDWDERAVELIAQVWPRQRAARSPAVSSALVRLMLAGGSWFPALVAAGRDLLVPFDREMGWSVDAGGAAPLATEYPDAMLDLLTATLPEDASAWPFRTETLIEALGEGELAHDPRLQDLRRRLASR